MAPAEPNRGQHVLQQLSFLLLDNLPEPFSWSFLSQKTIVFSIQCVSPILAIHISHTVRNTNITEDSSELMDGQIVFEELLLKYRNTVISSPFRPSSEHFQFGRTSPAVMSRKLWKLLKELSDEKVDVVVCIDVATLPLCLVSSEEASAGSKAAGSTACLMVNSTRTSVLRNILRQTHTRSRFLSFFRWYCSVQNHLDDSSHLHWINKTSY